MMYMHSLDPEVTDMNSIEDVCNYYSKHKESRGTIALIVLGWKLGINTRSITSDHLRSLMETLDNQALSEMIFAVKTNIQ